MGGVKKPDRRISHSLFFTIIFLPIVFLTAATTPNIEGEIIREIVISGNTQTSDRVILGELASRKGELFLEENIKEDIMRLERLGIFASIDIGVEPIDNGVSLNIEVVETTTILPSLRIQITDENGIAVGGGVKHINLLGQALFGQFAATFGRASTFEVILDRPVSFRSPFSYRFDYFHRNRENVLNDYFESADELFLTTAARLGGPFRVGARFMFQIIRSDTDGKTLSPDNTDKVFTAGLFVGHDSRDALMYTRSGWWNEVELTRSGLLGTDSEFWRLNVDISRYLPLGPGGTLVVSSLTTLTGGKVGRDIAPWQDFAIGGTNTIRGWELGSRVGKHQFINTIEYRHPLLAQRAYNILGFSLPLGMQLAFFADMGSAWSEPDMFTKNLIAGAGVGLRFVMPVVGVSRFDIGFGERGVRILLHLSSFEKTVRQRDRVR